MTDLPLILWQFYFRLVARKRQSIKKIKTKSNHYFTQSNIMLFLVNNNVHDCHLLMVV